MKKTTLTVVLLLSIICAFGQKKAVNRAFSEAKMEKPNFQEARDNIKGALTNPETKDDAKTWYVAGFVENSYFEKDNVQKTLGMTLKDGDGPMYDALVKSYEYFLQAIALDTLPNEKGKIKPRYVKDIRKTLKQNIDGYANAGVYYFTQKEYKKAYDVWGTVSYTHLRAHETGRNLVCRLLLEKKKKSISQTRSCISHTSRYPQAMQHYRMPTAA